MIYSGPSETTIIYPYLFQTCGFQAIDDIRAELESQQDWDYAKSADEAAKYQDLAAQRFKCVAPFSPDQKSLRAFLINRKAGLNISTYAWGLYASLPASKKKYAY